jgi:hypothetical protein
MVMRKRTVLKFLLNSVAASISVGLRQSGYTGVAYFATLRADFLMCEIVDGRHTMSRNSGMRER